MALEITIPCSPEQADVFIDGALLKTEIGLLPDERAWMKNQVRAKLGHGNFKILGADLQTTNDYEWKIRYMVTK